VKPGGLVGGMENVFLTFRANSIYNIMRQNGGLNSNGTWIPQDSAEYGPTLAPNAEGWGEWTHRYRNFVVLGSRIQATFEPYAIDESRDAVPTTFYLNLNGSDNVFGTGTQMAAINKLPYTKRASIIPGQHLAESTFNGNQGVRLHMTYSAKKFEGVEDVKDNRQLSGEFSGQQTEESSFFTV